MKYTCPVCGYDHLRYPPANHTICPSCGTQFEYHDCTYSHETLRHRWIEAGARWHSRRLAPPSCWSAVEQLRHIGYEATESDLRAIASADKEELKVGTSPAE
jgi:uncharacterized Zn finger protein (UPF0148 family)